MRIVYMGNRKIGLDLRYFLAGEGQELVWCTTAGDKLPSDSEIACLCPDIGVSILYPHILRPSTIALFPRGVVNLHPSLLPYCRGKYPAFWAIVDRKPAGATLHYMDSGVDTGDIIAQTHFPYDETDTCEDIYKWCVRKGEYMFMQTWGYIEHGIAKRVPQPHHKATFHLSMEIPSVEQWFPNTVKEIRNEFRR